MYPDAGFPSELDKGLQMYIHEDLDGNLSNGDQEFSYGSHRGVAHHLMLAEHETNRAEAPSMSSSHLDPPSVIKPKNSAPVADSRSSRRTVIVHGVFDVTSSSAGNTKHNGFVCSVTCEHPVSCQFDELYYRYMPNKLRRDPSRSITIYYYSDLHRAKC